MKKKALEEMLMNLQMYADEPDEGAQDEPNEEEGEQGEEEEEQEEEEDEEDKPKYTEKQMNQIIRRKKAEWKRKQGTKSEAEKLREKSSQSKEDREMAELRKKVAELEKKDARAEMLRSARQYCADKKVTISDRILERLIDDDADTTQENIDDYIADRDADVTAAVKDRYKGSTPKTGKKSTITKEQIMAVKNPIERQRLIKENMTLFK